MGVKATELRKGTVIEQDGQLLLITEYHHHTPGNLRAIIHIKTRNLSTGTAGQMRLGSSDVLEVAYLDKKNAEYLYREANGDYVFMDTTTYEQFHLSEELVGERMGYVKENTQCTVTFHGTTPLGVELPATVVLEVTEAEPAVRGNTATNVKKEAVVETGMKVKVPSHVSVGDKVKIRTEDGEFLGRA
ncbi:MAG TPA: elongation factor P [Planctomycetota bacterium]|nr:elongation factor P [Planctomycetota bacterium]